MYILFKRQGFFLYLIFMASCGIEREEPESISSPFYPLSPGKFWEYRVAETVYFGENDFETQTFFYRDQIVDQYLNAENEFVYRVERQSSTDRNNWINERVFTLLFSQNRIIRHYNNRQDVILVYPLNSDLEWDGNSLNNLPPENFTVERQGDHILDNLSFPETVTIRQQQEDDLITIRDNRYEVFAKDIGMVESYYEVFRYCSRNDCLGEQIIQEGRFTHLKLIDYGQM